MGILPIIFVVLTASILSFYSINETRQMIELHEMPPRAFLFQKIRRNLVLFTLFMSPLILASFIVYAQQWYFIVALVLFFYNLLIFSILSKYAHFEPGASSSFHEFLNGLALVGTLLPPFAPVVLVMNFKFYKKAIRTLSPYLNDYN
jgi:hypothetical protein